MKGIGGLVLVSATLCCLTAHRCACIANVEPKSPTRLFKICKEYLQAQQSPNLRQTCDGLLPTMLKRLYEIRQSPSSEDVEFKTDIHSKLLVKDCVQYLKENLSETLAGREKDIYSQREVLSMRSWMRRLTKYVSHELKKRKLTGDKDSYEFLYPLLFDTLPLEQSSSPLQQTAPQTAIASSADSKVRKSAKLVARFFGSNPPIEAKFVLDLEKNASLKKRLLGSKNELAKKALTDAQLLCSSVLKPEFGYLYYAALSLFKYMKDNQTVRDLVFDGQRNKNPTLFNLILLTNVCRRLQSL